MHGPDASAVHAGVQGAIAALVGVVVSGPLAVGLVEATHPQPTWQGPAELARSYHPVQLVPYAGGILLVGGLVWLVASLRSLATKPQRPRADAALLLASAFASLVLLNYVVQTTFVPVLARDWVESNGPILSALTMSNPKSLAWAVEMWGWGLFGIATWLLAPVFGDGRFARATRIAWTINGPMSVAGTMWTVADPGWVTTPAGLAAFTLWNVLLAVMAALALASLRAIGGAVRGHA